MNKNFDCIFPVYIDNYRVYPVKFRVVSVSDANGYILIADGNKKGYGFTEVDVTFKEPIRFKLEYDTYFSRKSLNVVDCVKLKWSSRIPVDQKIVDSLWCDDG